jgi:hypothetical protein
VLADDLHEACNRLPRVFLFGSVGADVNSKTGSCSLSLTLIRIFPFSDAFFYGGGIGGCPRAARSGESRHFMDQALLLRNLITKHPVPEGSIIIGPLFVAGRFEIDCENNL